MYSSFDVRYGVRFEFRNKLKVSVILFSNHSNRKIYKEVLKASLTI